MNSHTFGRIKLRENPPYISFISVLYKESSIYYSSRSDWLRVNRYLNYPIVSLRRTDLCVRNSSELIFIAYVDEIIKVKSVDR